MAPNDTLEPHRRILIASDTSAGFPAKNVALPWWDFTSRMRKGGTLRLYGRTIETVGAGTLQGLLQFGLRGWCDFGARLRLRGGSFGDELDVSIGAGVTLRIPACDGGTLEVLGDSTTRVLPDASYPAVNSQTSVLNATWRDAEYPSQVRVPRISYYADNIAGGLSAFAIPPHATHVTVRGPVNGSAAPATSELVANTWAPFNLALVLGERTEIPDMAQRIELRNPGAAFSAVVTFELGDF